MQSRRHTSALIHWIAATLFALTFVTNPVFAFGADARQGSSSGDEGLVGENRYVSPQFGYEVTWEAPWAARESETLSLGGNEDRLWLDAETLDEAQITVRGAFTDQTPEEVTQERADVYLANYEVVSVSTYAVDEDTAGLTAFIGRDDNAVVALVQVHALVEGESVIAVTLVGKAAAMSDVLAAAVNQVAIDEEPVLQGIAGSTAPPADNGETASPETGRSATPTATEEQTESIPPEANEAARVPSEASPTPEPSEAPSDEGRNETGVLGNTYESPTYGYTLEWDPSVWGVNTQQSGSGPDGDFLLLESRLSQLSFQGFDSFGGDPVECLPVLEEFLLDVGPDFEIENVEPINDEDGNPIRAQEDDRAYATYAITMSDTASNQQIEIGAYLECRAIPDREAVMVVIFTTLLEDFAEEFPDAEAVIQTVTMPNEEPAPSSREETPEPAENSENAPTGDGQYESPTYGFTFTYDPEIWEVDTEASQAGTDLIVLTDGPSTLQFLATEDFGGNAVTCVNETIQSIRDQDGVTAVELDRGADGRTITGGDETDFYAQYTVHVSGGTFASTGNVTVYLECHSLSESAVLLTQHIVSTDRYEDEQPLVEEILATLERPS